MQFINKEQKELFDGSDSKFSLPIAKFNLPTLLLDHEVKVSNLVELEDLKDEVGIDIALKIVNELKTKIDDFDGHKIYLGTQKGTELHYENLIIDSKNYLIIYSFGEIQPTRFTCLYEAIIEI